MTIKRKLLLSLLSAQGLIAGGAEPSSLDLRVALLGNPVSYQAWSPEKVHAIKEAGFNAIQLNTAWLSRPHDEALNLRDVVTRPGDTETSRVRERREELKKRAAMAKAAGLRTIFHFGSPYMWRNPETDEVTTNSPKAFQTVPPWFDTTNPKVVEYELALLKELRMAMPEVDDILVYTYDQDAWQASEFGLGPSRGVPLYKRLPKFLGKLHQAWTDGRETSHTLWWEPWELSAGQVYHCLPALPLKGFGLMLHSNIAEVQISNPVDVWLRNTCRMAKERGIPVVVEGFFGSATEEIQPLAFPFPRLTDEQLLEMRELPGVVGVKEYFGVVPDGEDLNLAIFTARIENPTSTTQELLRHITVGFGAHHDAALRMVEQLSDAMQIFPWDVSWYARLAGTADPIHGWRGAAIRGQQVETPSWESTRRALFMKTDDANSHPFLLEDVQLRCELTVSSLDEALTTGRELMRNMEHGGKKAWLKETLEDVDKFRRVAKSYALHLRESNVALLLRADMNEKRSLTPHLMAEMAELLEADIANQLEEARATLSRAEEGKLPQRHSSHPEAEPKSAGDIEAQARKMVSEAMAMRDLFRENPEEFLAKHLLPHDKDLREKGIFTLTTR